MTTRLETIYLPLLDRMIRAGKIAAVVFCLWQASVWGNEFSDSQRLIAESQAAKDAAVIEAIHAASVSVTNSHRQTKEAVRLLISITERQQEEMQALRVAVQALTDEIKRSK